MTVFVAKEKTQVFEGKLAFWKLGSASLNLRFSVLTHIGL